MIDLVGGLGFAGLVLAAAGLAFAETAIGLDLLIPGEAGTLVAGAVASEQGHPLAVVVLGAAVGATAGDSVSYAIGRRWGLSLLERWRLTRRRLLPKAKKAEDWFERRGGAAILVGRWVGALRAIVPVVAGTAKMPFGRFLAWNVLASITWAGTAVTLGYVFGTAAAKAVDRAGVWVYLAVVVAAGLFLLVRRHRHKASPRPSKREGSGKE